MAFLFESALSSSMILPIRSRDGRTFGLGQGQVPSDDNRRARMVQYHISQTILSLRDCYEIRDISKSIEVFICWPIAQKFKKMTIFLKKSFSSAEMINKEIAEVQYIQ